MGAYLARGNILFQTQQDECGRPLGAEPALLPTPKGFDMHADPIGESALALPIPRAEILDLFRCPHSRVLQGVNESYRLLVATIK